MAEKEIGKIERKNFIIKTMKKLNPNVTEEEIECVLKNMLGTGEDYEEDFSGLKLKKKKEKNNDI